MASYSDRPPERLDTFEFSDEIEAELAALDAAEARQRHSEQQPPAASAAAAAFFAHQHHTAAHAPAPSPAAAAAAAASAEAARDPRAYAEAYFSGHSSAASAAATAAASSPAAYAARTAASAASHSPQQQFHAIQAAAAAQQQRKLSIDAGSRGRPPLGLQQLQQQQFTPQTANGQSSVLSAASSSYGAGGGYPLGAASDSDPSSFYDSDASFFNLGGSSFPLLPHNTLYESEAVDVPSSVGGHTEKAFSPSGRVHAQHFTSILNQPQGSLLREGATRAAAVGTAYLPTLASIWTFTTGQAPPPAVSKASAGILAFAEEGSGADPGPFVLPPCPALDKASAESELGQVRQYVAELAHTMQSYARNHPTTTMAHKLRVRAEEKAARKAGGAAALALVQRDARRRAREHGESDSAASGSEDSDDDSFAASSAAARAGGGARNGMLPLSSPSHAAARVATPAQLAVLDRDLRVCKSSIPPEYFASDFTLAKQKFWRDEHELNFMKSSIAASLHGDGERPTTPGGSDTNPYTSFDALASYHSSASFQLPSLEQQKAAQLRAYKASQARLSEITAVNEVHMALQSVLSGHLDLVEQNLHSQISTKSWLFFQALQDIGSIQEDTRTCLRDIAGIRAHVAALESSLSRAGLNVVQQLRRKQNLLRTARTVEMMLQALSTAPTVQLLLASGDYSAALSLLGQTRTLLNGDLKGVKALKHVQVKLTHQSRLVRQLLELDFCGVAIRGGGFFVHDLDPSAVPSASPLDTSTGAGSKAKQQQVKLSVLPASGKVRARDVCSSRTLSEEELERLSSLISSLLELGNAVVHDAFASYSSQLQDVLKTRLMDLVYELLNQVTREEKEHAARLEAGSAATTTEDQSSGSERDSVDEDEDDGEGDDDRAPSARSRLSQKDQSAAMSLLSDAVPVASSGAEESPEVSASPPITSNGDASHHRAESPAPPSSSPSLNPVPNAPVTGPAANGTHSYGERRQAAVALPVGAQRAPIAAPPAAPALAPPSAAAPASSPAQGATVPAGSPATQSASTAVSTAPSPMGANNITVRFSALKHEQFLALLQPMFTSLMDLLQRASNIRQLTVTILNSLPSGQQQAATAQGGTSGPSSPVALTKEALVAALNEQLVALVEYVHAKVGKILQTRGGVHAALTLPQFRQFLDSILQFIQEGEKLCGRTFYGLRGVLLSQAKAFLQTFHQRCVTTLGAALEQEKWMRVDVPTETQSLLDAHFVPTPSTSVAKKTEAAQSLASPAAHAAVPATPSTPAIDPFADPAATATPSATPVPTSASASAEPAWQNKAWNESAEGSGGAKANGTPSAAASITSPASAVQPVAGDAAVKPATTEVKRVLFVPRPVVKGAPPHPAGAFMRFPVVPSALMLLRMIGEYIECASQLQAVGSDILNKLVELLQMFNSRSCQLVLGAGAMHLSGLKSITATHLALASQSVGLLVTQIPVLRAVLASKLPPKQHVLLSSLDRVSRDCLEHQKEIFSKLVAIMSELISGMVESLESMPWTQGGAAATAAVSTDVSPAAQVDECVKLLMKQTCSLHRALSDLLLPEQRDLIFRDISHLFQRTLADFLQQLDTKHPQVKLKISYNVHHILTRLKTCTGVDEAAVQELGKFVQ